MKLFSKMKEKIKKYGKYVLGVLTGAALVSQLVLPAVSMRADQPRFNFMENDYELFRGVNYTQGEDVWKDPVSGTDSDTFIGLIYYHNGILDSVAENTRIKVTIPAETTNGTAKLSATISADNADTVSDTIIDGQIVGRSGLTVNLDKDADLEYIPGTAHFYPDSKDNPNTFQAFPGGQSGDEIVSASGVNIGDIAGCWEHAGFVSFGFKAKAKVIPANLTIQKTVKNISDNQIEYVESAQADQNETVKFKIEITNNGQSVANNVLASDRLPTDLSYVNGSAQLEKGGAVSVISGQDLLASEINIGNLEVNQKATLTFDSNAPAEITASKCVINSARARIDSADVSDTAQVCLEAGVINIIKSKSAYNQTQKIDATTRVAGPGDIIEYTLVTRNTGSLSTDYVVSDGIADILEYANVINISDGGSVIDGPANTNEAKIVQYPSVSIPANGEIVRKFTVKVVDVMPSNPVNGYHFDNKMYNKYGNDILILIGWPKPPVKEPILTIDKYVRNVSGNEIDFVKSNTAYAGDTLEYKITFENIGAGVAENVRIYDVLPPNVTLDPSTSAIISLNGLERVMSEKITDGITVILNPGDRGYIRYNIKTSISLAQNEQLINTAYLDNHGDVISAQANTIIKQKVISVSQKSLPKTGAEAGILISAFASMLGTLNLVYLKQKKALYKAATSIRVW